MFHISRLELARDCLNPVLRRLPGSCYRSQAGVGSCAKFLRSYVPSVELTPKLSRLYKDKGWKVGVVQKLTSLSKKALQTYWFLPGSYRREKRPPPEQQRRRREVGKQEGQPTVFLMVQPFWVVLKVWALIMCFGLDVFLFIVCWAPRPYGSGYREVVVTPTVVWSEHLRGLWSEHLHQIMCSHDTYTSCVVTRPTLNYVQSEDLH
jgi:hypothetical protein